MRPILTGPNKNLEIGPFNTNYNNIEADITRAGLSIQPNRWNDPLIVESNENTSWKFYPTEDFFFHAIPYDVRWVLHNRFQKYHNQYINYNFVNRFIYY